MLFAPIPPIPWLKDFSCGNYHLVLPHLLKDTEYFHHYETQSGYKIMDNGAAEGVHTEPDQLINAARLIHADEIVAPDVLGDYAATVEATIYFGLNYAVRYPEYRYGAVLQGTNHKEWLACLRAFEEMPWIDILYLPRHMSNVGGYRTRYYFLQEHAQKIRHRFDAVHCLGMSRHLEETRLLATTYARGIDTSLPFVAALDCRLLTEGIYVNRQQGYFYRGGTELHSWRYARQNNEKFVEWCTREKV